MSWIVAHLPPPAGLDLHIASLWPGGRERRSFSYEGATFHLLPCPARGRAATGFLLDRLWFRSLFRELRPDLVHAWGTEDSYGQVALDLAGPRAVIGIQGLINEYLRRTAMPARYQIIRWTERWTLARARWVVAESAYSAELAQKYCSHAHVLVVEHPLRREFLESESTSGQSGHVLFLGTVDVRKGIFDACEAFIRTAATHEGMRLRIAGKGPSAVEAKVRSLIREAGCEERVDWLGTLSAPELVAVMQDSALLLLPTRVDTGPTALKEALAMGLWPVCYDNSGPGEYLRKFQRGTLVPDGDVDALARALHQVWRDRSWMGRSRDELGAIRHYYSPKRIWDELRELYARVMQKAD
jgi:glycosyltransferase involved in cell wall biosynthesis